ncbi:MAG TPA: GrpB family protein [Candidatus Saccharimonadales bacterium]|nr:GrpB family protein [Candidatus Saccharimonadales bacterium]
MSLGLHRARVKLVPHNPAWAEIYKEEEKLLRHTLTGTNLIDLQHVGSTSIPDILAKPLMGILAVVKDLKKVIEWQPALESNGYQLRENDKIHLLFAKGPERKRTIHLHIAEQGSEYAAVTVLFRDYLRKHPEVAKQYEDLKIELAKKYADNRKLYTSSKDEFIKKVLKKAGAEI